MGYEAPVVVGLDESDAAAEALRWAAWQSSKTAAPLVAVHAYRGDPGLRDRPDGRKTEESLVRARATQWIHHALSQCRVVPWRTHLVVVEGSPSRVLRERSREAGMLVLGRGSDTADPAVRVRPLSELLRATSACPVVCVPATSVDAGRPGAAGPPREPARLPAATRRS